MKTLEEIHIRVSEGTREALIAQLQESLQNLEHSPNLMALHIYCHTKYETDLCLHLSWAVSLPLHGSTLALNILAGVQELGSVKHTVWMKSSEHKTTN